MKRKYIILGLLISSLSIGSYGNERNPKSRKPTHSYRRSSKINFYQGTYDDFLRDAKKQKKAILLDFWASWCAPCKKMENETFADDSFSQYLNENFLTYKVNIDTFDGMEIADRFAVDAFPTLVMLDNKGKYVNRLRGFFPANYLINELQKNKDMKGKRFIVPKGKPIEQ